MIKNPKVGDEVWLMSEYAGFIQGRITEVRDNEPIKIRIRWERQIKYDVPAAGITMSTEPFEDVWSTLEDAKAAEAARIEAIKDGYRKTINSPEDLARFCFKHCVYQIVTYGLEKYTDQEAREVAEEKFEEFGIEL